MNLSRLGILVVLMVSLIVLGCKEKSSLNGLVKCSGKITLDGQPLEGVDITFVPTKSEKDSRAGSARSEADGVFHARTLQPNDGLFPGDYNVIVSKRVSEGKLPTQAEIDEANKKGISIPVSFKETMPVKYTKPDTSGIKFTITAEGSKELTIDLKSK